MCLPNACIKIKWRKMSERRSPPRSESINPDARGIVAEPLAYMERSEIYASDGADSPTRAPKGREAARPKTKHIFSIKY